MTGKERYRKGNHLETSQIYEIALNALRDLAETIGGKSGWDVLARVVATGDEAIISAFKILREAGIKGKGEPEDILAALLAVPTELFGKISKMEDLAHWKAEIEVLTGVAELIRQNFTN